LSLFGLESWRVDVQEWLMGADPVVAELLDRYRQASEEGLERARATASYSEHLRQLFGRSR